MRLSGPKSSCFARKICSLILIISIIGGLTALTACGGGEKPASVDYGKNAQQAKTAALTPIKLDQDTRPDGLASALYDFDASGNLQQPVTVTIPLSAQAPREDPQAKAMLGIGITVEFETGGSGTFYRYVQADLADGKASATFTPAEYTGARSARGMFNNAPTSQGAPSGERLSLGIFWCSTMFQNGGHFLVNFPAQAGKTFINYNDRVAFLNDLEAVYNDYLSKSYTYSLRIEWPMEVNVQRMDVDGAYDYGGDGAQGEININRKFFENGYQSAAVKPLLAHEFFHFVQFNFATVGNDNLWFDEATSTYFESKKLGQLPSIVSQYKERVFSGVIPPENTSADGYARAPMIQFMAKKRSEDFILKAYSQVKAGDSWKSALEAALGEPKAWAADFYAALVKGEVGDYAPYTLHKTLAEGSEAEIGIRLPLVVPLEAERKQLRDSGEDAVLGETSVTVNAYGAKLVALTIDDTNSVLLEDSDRAIVRVSEGADARVMAVRGKEAADILKEEGGFPLQELKTSLENNLVYLVLVTGLHQSGQQDYTVSVVIPDSGPDEGTTTYWEASRSTEIYNGYYALSESFSVSATTPFIVQREFALPDTIAVQILVDNRKSEVSLELNAAVGNPNFTDKLLNLVKEGYLAQIKQIYWKGPQGEVIGPQLFVIIPKGTACGATYTFNVVVGHVIKSSGIITNGGSAAVLQVSIGCLAP